MSKERSLDEYIIEIRKSISKKEFDTYEALSRDLLQSGLNSKVGYKELATALRFNGKLTESGEILELALAEHPDCNALLAEKAMLQFVRGDDEGALNTIVKTNIETKENINRALRIYKKTKVGKIDVNTSSIYMLIKNMYKFKMWSEIKQIINETPSLLEDLSLKNEIISINKNAEAFLGCNIDMEQEYKNIVLIPPNNRLWVEISNLLFDYKYNLVLSIDHNPTGISKPLRSQWPDAEIYNAFDLSKGESLLYSNNSHFPPSSVFESKEFLDVKLKAFSIMQRQDDEGRFRYIDREAIFFSLFNFSFSKVKELSIQTVLAGHSPHSPSTFIFAEAARLAGARVFHFTENPLVPLFHLSENYFGKRFCSNRKNKIADPIIKQINAYIDNIYESRDDHERITPDYMIRQMEHDKKNKTSDISFNFEILPRLNSSDKGKSINIKKGHWQIRSAAFLNNDRLNIDGLSTDEIKSFLRHGLEYQYNLISTKKPDKDIEFVYYPLHYEPEKTSNPDGGKFYDTYHSLLALRNLIPAHIPIYVKEHYSQFTSALSGYKGKSFYFYQSLASIKNVHFIDYNESSKELIKKSLFVATKTGTAGFESVILGAKTLLFGYPWYYGCPNVFHIEEISSYKEIIHSKKVATPREIKDFVLNWANEYSIIGCMSGSHESIMKKRFEEHEVKHFMNLRDTAKSVLDTLTLHNR